MAIYICHWCHASVPVGEEFIRPRPEGGSSFACRQHAHTPFPRAFTATKDRAIALCDKTKRADHYNADFTLVTTSNEIEIEAEHISTNASTRRRMSAEWLQFDDADVCMKNEWLLTVEQLIREQNPLPKRKGYEPIGEPRHAAVQPVELLRLRGEDVYFESGGNKIKITADPTVSRDVVYLNLNPNNLKNARRLFKIKNIDPNERIDRAAVDEVSKEMEKAICEGLDEAFAELDEMIASRTDPDCFAIHPDRVDQAIAAGLDVTWKLPPGAEPLKVDDRHIWRACVPPEVMEEGGICQRCGRYASEAAEGCVEDGPLDVVYDDMTLRQLLDLDEIVRMDDEPDMRRHFHRDRVFTEKQRAAISAHWSAELRKRIEASKERDRQLKRPPVTVDHGELDE